MSDYVVGLRGGIGTGKTTVSNLFLAKGITIADADVSARTVVEPGKPAFNAIVEHFGPSVVLANGQLDRAKLRKIVFADTESRRFLEHQTRRPIVEDLASILRYSTSDYAIVVLSTGLGKTPMMQRLLVVDAPADVQIERVMVRDGNPRDQVEAILQAQPSREERRHDVDDIIVNDGNIDALKVEVEKLHALYLSLSEKNKPKKSTTQHD